MIATQQHTERFREHGRRTPRIVGGTFASLSAMI
jgi:hypothetical protein